MNDLPESLETINVHWNFSRIQISSCACIKLKFLSVYSYSGIDIITTCTKLRLAHILANKCNFIVCVGGLYCCRISAKLSCPMNLQSFPMDTQICPMLFESCEYNAYVHVLSKNAAGEFIG